MNKLNGWARLGIVLSVAWLTLMSFVYFNEIISHPSFFANNLPFEIFDWIEDTEGTAKEHAEAKAKGNEIVHGFVLAKPMFSLKGYLMLTVLPLLIGWLGILLSIWVIGWVKEGFRT